MLRVMKEEDQARWPTPTAWRNLLAKISVDYVCHSFIGRSMGLCLRR
jgi:hypothetical protein